SWTLGLERIAKGLAISERLAIDRDQNFTALQPSLRRRRIRGDLAGDHLAVALLGVNAQEPGLGRRGGLVFRVLGGDRLLDRLVLGDVRRLGEAHARGD